MPDKFSQSYEVWSELFRSCLPYLTTLLLSCWGGFVSYIQKLRIKKHQFSVKELAFDLVISSFAGLLTYFMCRVGGLDETMSAVLIAISGHMGTRAIASFEKFRDKIFTTGGTDDAN